MVSFVYLRLFSGVTFLSTTLTGCLEPVFNDSKITAGGGVAIDPTTVCSGTTINGVSGTAVCGGDTAVATTLDVSQSFAEGKYNALSSAPDAASYLSSVTMFGVAGTMLDRGTWDVSTGFPGAGAYANGSNAPDASSYLSTVTLFGTPGAIHATSPTQLAVAVGSENDDTVTQVTVSPTGANLFSGFIVDLHEQFKAANICAGKTIFGRLGQALCPVEISAGNGYRDSSVGITLKQEQESGACSNVSDAPLAQLKTRSSCEKSNVTNKWVPAQLTAERLVPDASKDFEKISGADYSTDAARKTHRNSFLRKYSDPTVAPSFLGDEFPNADCGVTGSHEARALACDVMWVATLGSTAGGNNWTLISFINGKEVWRDESTGLLWGDYMGDVNHCKASGNKQNSGYNCSLNTESWCSETGLAGGVSVPAGKLNSDEKGGMGLTSATGKVLWRLPTREDYLKAVADGAYHVLPELLVNNDNGWSRYFWTASVVSSNPHDAWVFDAGDDGYVSVYSHGRADGVGVRCIGR